jgi:hypothetical protein
VETRQRQSQAAVSVCHEGGRAVWHCRNLAALALAGPEDRTGTFAVVTVEPNEIVHELTEHGRMPLLIKPAENER